jgi:hypothetical protein
MGKAHALFLSLGETAHALPSVSLLGRLVSDLRSTSSRHSFSRSRVNECRLSAHEGPPPGSVSRRTGGADDGRNKDTDANSAGERRLHGRYPCRGRARPGLRRETHLSRTWTSGQTRATMRTMRQTEWRRSLASRTRIRALRHDLLPRWLYPKRRCRTMLATATYWDTPWQTGQWRRQQKDNPTKTVAPRRT